MEKFVLIMTIIFALLQMQKTTQIFFKLINIKPLYKNLPKNKSHFIIYQKIYLALLKIQMKKINNKTKISFLSKVRDKNMQQKAQIIKVQNNFWIKFMMEAIIILKKFRKGFGIIVK